MGIGVVSDFEVLRTVADAVFEAGLAELRRLIAR